MPNDKTGHLLTPQERTTCQQITRTDAPHRHRAAALLALDEGATQAQAGEQTGLSRGQVRYWLTKFRQRRLRVFPESLLEEIELAPTSALPETRSEETPQHFSGKKVAQDPEKEPAEVAPTEDLVKAKRPKKGKRSKKAKRGKEKTVKKTKKGQEKAEKAKDVVKAKKAKGEKKAAAKATVKEGGKKSKKAKEKTGPAKDAVKAKKAEGGKKGSGKKAKKKSKKAKAQKG